jgi:hypothetical protein
MVDGTMIEGLDTTIHKSSKLTSGTRKGYAFKSPEDQLMSKEEVI